MQNFYQILSIEQAAKEPEIKEAIRNALRLWTNRTNAPQMDRRQEAERTVKLIEEAETILLNAAKRAEYDQKLRSAPADEGATDHKVLEAAKDLIAEGRRLLTDGNIADALYVATKATERDGSNPEAWALLGEARFRFGDVEDAIYEYKRAIKLKPNDPFYYADLGDVFNATNNLDEALTQYQRAAKIAPNVPMFRAGIGRVLLRQEKSTEAIPILEGCVKEDPQNEYFQWELAIAYIDSTQSKWTLVGEGHLLPPGYYATDKAQIIEALELIAKAEKLKFDDQAVKDHIAKVKTDIKSMLQRKFFGSILSPVLGGFIYMFFYGLGLILAPLYFYASRPPVYAINKRRLAGVLTTGESMSASDRGEGFGAKLFANALIGLGLPIMVVWNYVKNYTGENDLKGLEIQ